MTNLIENGVWVDGVFQLEVGTPTLGGPPGFDAGIPVTGHANAQAQQLANRTKYLKDTYIPEKIDDHNHSAVAHPELSAFITSEADRAEVSADAAQAAGNIYPDTVAGIAATTANQYFSVPSANSTEYLVLYKNNAGVAEAIKTYPSALKVSEIDQRVQWVDEKPLTVKDQFGFIAIEYDNLTGLSTKEVQITDKKLDLKGFVSIEQLSEDDSAAVLVRDSFGFVNFESAKDAPSLTSNLVEKDSKNIAYANSLRTRKNNSTTPAAYDYNVVLMYGQSLASGTEGWPALTTTVVEPGNLLMVGNSTRPTAKHETTWLPVGGSSAWKNLVEVVQSSANTEVILTPAEQAALSPGDQSEGETGAVSAVHFWRRMQLMQDGLLSDPSKKIVLINCACGGRTVEQLSKGASPELYARITSALATAKSNADAEGKSIGLVSVIYAQGEYNYVDTYGGTTDKTTFKALTSTLFDNIAADSAVIFGQTLPPSFITYQTGGAYTRDEQDLSVGMAQLELSQERDDVFLAAPNYHVTDKFGHLDSNGYRWLGQHYGAALHAVIDRRENWFPLQPINAEISGVEILVNFAVPVPPLVARTAYYPTSPINLDTLGFRVTDDGVDIPLSGVQIVGSTMVLVTLSKPTTGVVKLWYGSKTGSNGNGNLFDSNQMNSMYKYVYTAGSGQYTGANIAALVDKYYPLNNPCVAFCITPEVV